MVTFNPIKVILVSVDKELMVFVVQVALVDPEHQTPEQGLDYLAQDSAHQLLDTLTPVVQVP